MTQLPSVSPETLKWIRENCPSLGIYGDSGQGKTHLTGSLFYRAEYWPVRYIDGDDGASTIAAFASDPAICQHRNYSTHRKPGQDDFKWFMSELALAKTAECGSIVIEGFSRFYNAEQGRRLADDPDASGNTLRKLYIPAANRAAAMIGAGQEIKRHRKQHGTGVPITYTLNVKEHTFKVGRDEVVRLLPALSPNKTRLLMEGCDFFAEITRDDHGSRLHGELDTFNKFRKVRNEVLLSLLRSKKNPTIPWILDEWCKAEASQRTNARPVIELLLAQFKQSLKTETPTHTPNETNDHE